MRVLLLELVISFRESINLLLEWLNSAMLFRLKSILSIDSRDSSRLFSILDWIFIEFAFTPSIILLAISVIISHSFRLV